MSLYLFVHVYLSGKLSLSLANWIALLQAKSLSTEIKQLCLAVMVHKILFKIRIPSRSRQKGDNGKRKGALGVQHLRLRLRWSQLIRTFLSRARCVFISNTAGAQCMAGGLIGMRDVRRNERGFPWINNWRAKWKEVADEERKTLQLIKRSPDCFSDGEMQRESLITFQSCQLIQTLDRLRAEGSNWLYPGDSLSSLRVMGESKCSSCTLCLFQLLAHFNMSVTHTQCHTLQCSFITFSNMSNGLPAVNSTSLRVCKGI